MSFRVKLRIKSVKPLKLPVGDPELVRRLYEAAKQEQPDRFHEWRPRWDCSRTQDWTPAPGVTYMLWNGGAPISQSVVL